MILKEKFSRRRELIGLGERKLFKLLKIEEN
jgi:hypothetical protein